MIIVDSSNYIPESYSYDFGRIPDAFLPIGNTRLIDVIFKRLACKDENVLIVIPNDFNIDKISLNNLEILHINFIKKSNLFELNNYFDKNQEIKYIHRLALPIDKSFGFENFKSFSIELPSYGLLLKEEFNKEKLTKDLSDIYQFNKFLHQLYLFESKNTRKITTIDLRISAHYFKARAELVGIRFFNRIKIENNQITKKVEFGFKGSYEANWYKNTLRYIPNLSPIFISQAKDKNTYTFEYLPMVSLSEIYTYGKIDLDYWDKIFKSIKITITNMNLCALQLETKNNLKITDNQLNSDDIQLFKTKTIERLNLFAKTNKLDYPFSIKLNNNNKISVNDILYEMLQKLNKIKNKKIYAHGDFCLSNILYDSRINLIKLVDPRGHQEENNFKEIIKSQKYDLAKLAHSFLGYYDLINVGEIKADSYIVNKNCIEIKCNYSVNLYHELIYKKAYSYEFFDGNPLKDYLPATVLLFLSMLPLHSDNKIKQFTLLGNALRIYELIKKL
tara:strand:- start:1624 stop:3135 length:1512 start_codon:yes stop_codon:yes gene_type:complete